LIEAFIAYLEVQFTHINVQEGLADKNDSNARVEGESSKLSVEKNIKLMVR